MSSQYGTEQENNSVRNLWKKRSKCKQGEHRMKQDVGNRQRKIQGLRNRGELKLISIELKSSQRQEGEKEKKAKKSHNLKK